MAKTSSEPGYTSPGQVSGASAPPPGPGPPLAPGSVDTEQLANNAVTFEKIANESIQTEDIKNNAVTGGKIAALAVGVGNLANEAVSAAKILKETITAEKIAAGAITGAKLAASAVETAKIKVEAVTGEKIAIAAVGAEKIVAEAVTAVKLAKEAVTEEKLAKALQEKIVPSAWKALETLNKVEDGKAELGTQAIGVRIEDGSCGRLRGLLKLTAAVPTNTVIFKIPVAVAPPANVRCFTKTVSEAAVQLQIESTGSVVWKGPEGGTNALVVIDNITWNLT